MDTAEESSRRDDRKRTRASRVSATLGPLRSRYAVLVGVILIGLAVLLAWNVAHYPAGASPDANDHFKYTDTLRNEHRLPTPKDMAREHPGTGRIENTGQWYNPPVFYLVAAGIESSWDKLTKTVGLSGQAEHGRNVVQLLNVLLAVAMALFAFLTAREIFPRSRTVQVSVLLFVALAPTLTRTAIVYHGQMLAALLSTAALYVIVRALARGQVGVKVGALAGALLGLGILTRHLVLGTAVAMLLALAVYYMFTRRREALGMGGALVLVAFVLTLPWFIHQKVEYGDPFVASAKAPDTAFVSRQPKEFYLGRPFGAVFTHPYRPTLDNRMPQVLYTDWWGDYFLYLDVPPELRNSYRARASGRTGTTRLPDKYHDERVRQAYVGLLPTLLVVGGLFGLVLTGVRRREAHLLAIPGMVVVIAVEALAVYIGYPTSDGDIMRTTYLLTALPPLALAAGWSLSRIQEKHTTTFRVLLAVLAIAAVVDLQFLWLDQSVGR